MEADNADKLPEALNLYRTALEYFFHGLLLVVLVVVLVVGDRVVVSTILNVLQTVIKYEKNEKVKKLIREKMKYIFVFAGCHLVFLIEPIHC